MNRITSRFVMLIASAAIAPLIVYGAVSIRNLHEGIERSVSSGNRDVAQQVASQLKLYIDTNARILKSVGNEIAGTNLQVWQQSRILRNHVLEFPEFRELSLFDASGRLVTTSRLGPPATEVPATTTAHETYGVQVSPILNDEDNLPAVDLSAPIGTGPDHDGWLVARISLEELWRFVDRVRVAQEGYALVVSEDNRLVAHGDPDEKPLVALGAGSDRQPAEIQLLAEADPAADTFSRVFTDEDGREKLVTAARVPDLNWTAMVEQPTDEAFGLTWQLQQQLLAVIALALLGTIAIGWLWGRSFITRIFALTRATSAIAEGRMDERVSIGGKDEIHELGNAFNAMADKLVELQENVRKQERQAMFGRIAAGLVHDLSHPLQNIGNSCKLIVKMFDDEEYRETFRRTVEREMVVVRRVLEDLRNIARPIPLEHFPVDINRSVAEVVESMRQQAEEAGVTLRSELSEQPVFIEGDVFALGRVYRNLIVNAIQATAPGGQVVVGSSVAGDRAQIVVRDTGCGIPADRLSAIFEDFMTTKRRGLGLGLAISRKIVEQLGGQIRVTSEVGKGTTFVLEFPRITARPMLVAG